MEITEDQKSNAQVIQKAWEDASFKNELKANPVEAIEKLTGRKLNIPQGKTLVVNDQTDDSFIYFNLPAEPNINELELTEEQLEQVAGGILPLILYGVGIGIAIYAASHQH